MTRTKASLALGLAACVAVLAGCATATAPAPAALVAGQMAPDGTIVVCRSMALTGTRFPAKECKSEKAWEEIDAIFAANAKAETDKFQRLNTGCSTQGEGSC